MKVTLATGIFYPDVGGPAIHVRKIAEALVASGAMVQVVTYGNSLEADSFPFLVHRVSRHYPKVLRGLIYWWRVLQSALGGDIVYAFDLTAAGLPAFIVAKILRQKFVIRIGGDPIWERVVEHGLRFVSLRDYYAGRLYLEDRPGLFRLIKFILRHTDRVVLYNQMFKDFYIQYYAVAESKIIIIPNPIFFREQADSLLPLDPVILFAGRFVAYKNLPLVLRVFDSVREKLGRGRLILIGHGPDRADLERQIAGLKSSARIQLLTSLPQEKLFELIRESAIAIGPALSEFNPNFILEALSFGKPVLLSRGHGLTISLPDAFVFNPQSEAELAQKLENLLQPEIYKNAVSLIAALPKNQSWEKVTAGHLELLTMLPK